METRKCPVCEEPVPLRLLGTHAELESERLEEIIKQVGSTDVLLNDPGDQCVSAFLTSITANIYHLQPRTKFAKPPLSSKSSQILACLNYTKSQPCRYSGERKKGSSNYQTAS